VCPGPDADGDGVPDQCDPDDDGDTVPDELDQCHGFDDRNDQDGDGIPDDCDSRDDSPPSVAFGPISIQRLGFSRYSFVVDVSASDPQSNISHIEVTVTWERRICAPELETVSEGPFTDSADGVTSFEAMFGIPICSPDQPAQILFADITAFAVNGDGVASAPIFTSF
jgi:hypothetical protein